MPVVSNTSPILNLAIIGKLELLRQQFELELNVAGILGVLCKAKEQGIEISLRETIDDLRAKAGFRINDSLIYEILKLSGE